MKTDEDDVDKLIEEIKDLKEQIEVLWHRVGEGIPPDGVRCNVVGYESSTQGHQGSGEYCRDAKYEKGIWVHSSVGIVLPCPNVMFWRIAQGEELC